MSSDLSLDEDSKPLSRKWAGVSNFQQQGQLDWVNLTKISLRFSFGILSRLSAASVDPYTVAVGHMIGSAFELSRVGRQHMEEALRNLLSFGSLGNILWFGFGLGSLVRSLSVTEQGATLVALCAALAESFSDDSAAEILYEMVRLKTDSTSTPSISQWRALVNCCAGTLATTSFPTHAEAFMAMQVDGGLSSILSQHNVNAEPSEVAKVLIGIGKLSLGEWTSIEICGGREAGWLAAVGEWLFNLTVNITNEEGEPKYSSCHQNQNPQIDVFYTYTSSPESGGGSQLKVRSETYNLRAAELLISNRQEVHMFASVSSRVPWNRCLSASLGKAFQLLYKQKTAVGTIIGSAARIFEAVAQAESDVPVEALEKNGLHMDASFGSGLLQTALHWLPELSPLDEIMESASMAETYTDAKSKYEAHLALLASTCDCIGCGPRSGKSPLRHCVVAAVETIIVLCRILAATESVPDLFPHRLGLKQFLEIQTSRCRRLGDEKGEQSPFLRVSTPPPQSIDELSTLGDVLRLFTGRIMTDTIEWRQHKAEPIAFSTGGICVYYDSLCEASDDRQLAGMIHVVPGKIEYNERPYFCLEARRVTQDYEFDQTSEEKWGMLEDESIVNQVGLVVRESLHALEVLCEIRDSDGKPRGMNLSPRHLVLKSGQKRGLVSCDPSHSGARDGMEDLPQALRDQIATAGIKLRLLFSPVLGRCAALMTNDSRGTALILRENECIGCCVKAALKRNQRNILIISKARHCP